MIAVIDYGCGNLHSVKNAFLSLGTNVITTSKEVQIKNADRLVLPGVGSFGYGMKKLIESDIIHSLTEEVINKGKPILGICLGQQLMAKKGYEGGVHDGLGWLDGIVEKLHPGNPPLPLPHVGWNEVFAETDFDLFDNLGKTPTFYFTHSYAIKFNDKTKQKTAWCEYGSPFPAAVQKDNIAATQFHPEKSQDVGLQFLQNFIEWEP